MNPGKDVMVISIDGQKSALQAIIAGEMNATVECEIKFVGALCGFRFHTFTLGDAPRSGVFHLCEGDCFFAAAFAAGSISASRASPSRFSIARAESDCENYYHQN
jgi:hypothetical protein